MRTMTTATMMLMGSVMIAQAAGASPFVGGGMRNSPSPVSTYSLIGLTHDASALSTAPKSVRIERLPVAEGPDGLATVPFLVEPRVLAGFAYRARLSMNGEPVSERHIASGSAVIMETLVPRDGEIHATCIAVERVSVTGAGTLVATRCFDVIVPVHGQF